jgi:4-carboxymuconolactone decarboxylase
MTSAEQRAAYQAWADIAEDSNAVLKGPAKMWVDNPGLAKVLAPVAAHLDPPLLSLTWRERQIAVLAILGVWQWPFPLDANIRRGVTKGLSSEQVEALATGRPTMFEDQTEQLVYEVCTALAYGRWISHTLFDRAVELLGHDRITDMIALMGWYTIVALTLRFYDVPAGAQGLPQ